MLLKSIEELELKHSRTVSNATEYEGSVSTRGSRDGVYDWFPMVQRFTSRFLDKIFQNEELKKSRIILDPFMGSGNTLVACREHGKTGYGVDISPLFWFITHVKISDYTHADFEEANKAISNLRRNMSEAEVPTLSSFKRLFSRRQLHRLIALKTIACDLNSKASELLLFAMASELIRFSKAQRYGKGLRKKNTIESPDIKGVLRLKLLTMERDLEIFRENSKSKCEKLFPLCGDARELDNVINPLSGEREIISAGQVDSVITSPPYCNSADYIEMYKLEHWFLEYVKSYEEFKKMSYSTIRSHTTLKNENVEWRHFVVEEICSFLEKNQNLWNPKIPIMIRAYFDDLHRSLGQVKRVLRPCGQVFLLVGNSSYGGIPIPTDLLLAEAAESQGFDILNIRKIRRLTTSVQQWKLMDSENKRFLRESILTLKSN